MGIRGNYKMKIIKQIPVLIMIAWIFFVVSFSTAQQRVIQKTKPERPQPMTGQQMQKLPKPPEGLKPVKNLVITNVSMGEVATGAHFRIKFSVNQKSGCKIGMVVPEVKVKAEDGRIYDVRDRLCDVYSPLGNIRLSCDELRGGEGKYEYCGIFADKGPVWNQIGICLVINEPGLSTTECTWYPLGTKPCYFLQQN